MPPSTPARSIARRTVLRPLPALAAALLAAPVASLFPVRAAHALMAGLPPDSAQRRELSNALDSPWSGVAAVLVDGQVFSGALLDDRHLLTAAHVVAGRSAEQIRVQLNAGTASAVIAAAAVFVHPSYRGFVAPAHEATAMPAYDVAIVRLATPVAATVATYAPFFGSLRIGTALTMIGYGMSGHGHEGPTVAARADVRRIGANVLDQFVALPDQPATAGLFLYDFDPPAGGVARNRLGGPSLGNANETLAATGDSGAPVFIVRGQYRALVGVLTFVATAAPSSDGARPREPLSRFGGIGGGILLGPLRSWIESVPRAD